MTAGVALEMEITSVEQALMRRESSFKIAAANPTSSAFGVWQGLIDNRVWTAEKIDSHPDTLNPYQQIKMMRLYVRDRYQTAENAWKFWQRNHWY